MYRSRGAFRLVYVGQIEMLRVERVLLPTPAYRILLAQCLLMRRYPSSGTLARWKDKTGATR